MGSKGLMLKSKVLSVGFIRVILVIMLSTGGVAAIRSLHKSLEWIDRERQVALFAAQIEASAGNMRSALVSFQCTGDAASLAASRVHEQTLERELATLRDLVGAEQAQVKLLGELQTAFNLWKTQAVQPIVQAGKSVGQEPAQDRRAALARTPYESTAFERFRHILGSFRTGGGTALEERRADADKTAWYAQIFMVIGAVLIAIVSVTISSLVIDSITKPVGKAAALAEAISDGDLSGRIPVKGRDELSRLGMALDHMAEHLRSQTLQTREAVSVLSGAAAEITATAAQLSAGASRTSSALLETTSTVEEVKQAAKVSSQQAKNVAETARQSVEVAQAGLKATSETITRMNEIKEQMQGIGETVVKLSDHSRAIEQIIAAVQDIADQSNLLAVNASIEAARAGDLGKGFAVVAVEIKELADQSKAATDHARSILEDTKKWVSNLVMATEQGIKAVDAGVEQSSVAEQSIETLSRTVDSSAQSAALIDASAEHQFVGVKRVAGAVSSMEFVLSQHLAGTTELVTSARRLEALGGALRELVQRYRV